MKTWGTVITRTQLWGIGYKETSRSFSVSSRLCLFRECKREHHLEYVALRCVHYSFGWPAGLGVPLLWIGLHICCKMSVPQTSDSTES
jgi:hypothetical protein